MSEQRQAKSSPARGARQSPPVITRTGDAGMTGLLGERRVSKDSPQIEAIGAVDEATAAIGMARALVGEGTVPELLLQTQRDCYELMADLAWLPEHWGRTSWRVTGEKVAALERAAEHWKAAAQIEPKFVIPGDSVAGAALHLARTIVRRAERRAVALHDLGLLGNPTALVYLNRLSDLLFILARVVDESPRTASPIAAPGN